MYLISLFIIIDTRGSSNLLLEVTSLSINTWKTRCTTHGVKKLDGKQVSIMAGDDFEGL